MTQELDRWQGRNATERTRLRVDQLPTLIKSLKNGLWYCGIDVTQSQHFVVAHWRSRPDRASAEKLTYGRGFTPKDAYDAWVTRFRYIHKRLPSSHPHSALVVLGKNIPKSSGQSVKIAP